jgi:peptidoglycan/LPS O-acetylase OafA/YrhL
VRQRPPGAHPSAGSVDVRRDPPGGPAPGAQAPPRGPTAKRLDLQGVRALAVLLVALNHANVPFLRGGYVGVDVFFVLSGYFITGILLRDGFGGERGALGRVSIRRFYARRARRILPAACLTLITASIAAFVVYDLMGRDFLGTKVVLEDAFAASLFFANIHFIATANNYFAAATATMPSPFQHFWSLSVEEQFYLVWPSLLAVTFLACGVRLRRGHGAIDLARRRRIATWVVGLLIAGGCAASLLLSIQETAADPRAAYFSTPVRAWEFGCGAGLALLAARPRPLPRIPLAVLGWVGLAMVAAASYLYSGETPFPGAAALLPVIGTGLIVLAGMVPARGGVGRPLAIRPLTYIGDRSYAFYLWHYPMLTLVWEAAGHVLPVDLNLGLLAAAFALSALTYACFENPLRFARWLRGWRTALMVPVSMSASVCAVMVPIGLFDASLASQASAARRAQAQVRRLAPARHQPDPRNLWNSTPIPAVGVAAREARRGVPLPKDITPSLKELERENSWIGYDIPKGCQPPFGPGVHAKKICRLGDPHSRHVVALVGDSHAGMWMPALEQAARTDGFAIVPLDKPGCILNVIHRNMQGWPCANWYQWALHADHRLHPLATLVEFQLTSQLQAEPSTATADLRGVLHQVTRGVILTDPPGQNQQPSSCIARAGATMGDCSSRLPGTYVPMMHAIARLSAQTHDAAIPTLQWFCAKGTCPMVIDHTLTMRDRSHFTMEYGTLLGPLIAPVLKPVLGRLEHRAHARSTAAVVRLPLVSGTARRAVYF